MFSLAFSMFRWSVILMIAAGVTLTALLVQVRYEGAGRFQIGLKSRPGLHGTLIWTDGTLAVATPLPERTPRAVPTRQAPGEGACMRIREALGRAVSAYRQRTGQDMATLDIFALLEAEVIQELPSCPRGGAFVRAQGSTIRCTIHGSK